MLRSRNKHNMTVKWRRLILAFVLFGVYSGATTAMPYIPDDSGAIVTRLPSAIVAMSQQLRAAESRTDTNPEQLFALAYQSYQLAVTAQDPRAYGRVLAIIEQWPAQLEKPVSLRLIAAAVLQHNHEFSAALEELRAVLAKDPGNAQALLIQAQIGLVTANYQLTQTSCDNLVNRVEPALHLNCQAQLDGVTGDGGQALTSLLQALESNRPMSRQAMLEAHTTIATIAHRLDIDDLASSHYLAALLMAPDNTYLLSNYGQWLTAQQRYQDVVDLLGSEQEPSNNIELTVMLVNALLSSSQSADAARAEPLIAELERFFDAAYLRAEDLPYKEYARFALEVEDQPEAAVEAAIHNWQSQKEPSDALLLAETAIAASRQDLLDDLEAWTAATGLEYPRLNALITANAQR